MATTAMETTSCLYASRPCVAPRSRKTNGALHRLCATHRAKANAAQRRWHSRHRNEPDTQIPKTMASNRTQRRTRTSVGNKTSWMDESASMERQDHDEGGSFVALLSEVTVALEDDPCGPEHPLWMDHPTASIAAITLQEETTSTGSASPSHWELAGPPVLAFATSIAL